MGGGASSSAVESGGDAGGTSGGDKADRDAEVGDDEDSDSVSWDFIGNKFRHLIPVL